jgi:hypothetical protein
MTSSARNLSCHKPVYAPPRMTRSPVARPMPGGRKSGLLLACLVLMTGCQNAVTVRVELLTPKTAVARASAECAVSQATAQRYVREVVLTNAAINAVQNRLSEASDALVLMNYPKSAQSAQFPVLANLEKELDSFHNALQQHVDRATNLPAEPVSAADLQQLRSVQSRLAGLLALKTEPLARLETRLRENVPEKGKEKDKQAADAAIQSLVATVRAQADVVGFGGFRIVGVHRMNPADPIYQQVVNPKEYQASGVYSEAAAAANGDSTVVFVQEVPTYIRFFELDNDPTQLIRNVLYLMDKVLQAAVKYAAF